MVLVVLCLRESEGSCFIYLCYLNIWYNVFYGWRLIYVNICGIVLY